MDFNEINTINKSFRVNSYGDSSGWETRKTITLKELGRIRDLVDGTFDETKRSVVNKGLTKRQAFDILFKISNDSEEEYMHHIAYKNVLKEFIFNKKKLPDEAIYVEQSALLD